MGFLEAVFLVLLILKLTNHADLSWWWVFTPLAFAGLVDFLVLAGLLSRRNTIKKHFR